MKTMKTTDNVLGVLVTSRTVYAVLLQAGASGPVVLRRFTRHRNLRPTAAQPSLAGAYPELQEDVAGNDFNIQFGDGSGGGSELFLGSEFGVGAEAANGVEHMNAGAEQPAGSVHFMLELAEILDECRELGYESPQVAFCAAASDVAHVELHVTGKEKRKGKAAPKAEASEEKPARPERDALLGLLREQYKGEFNAEKVAFLPMTAADEGTMRMLAVIAKPDEAVEATLVGLREQRDERMPSVRLLDAEVALYLGLARAILRKGSTPDDAPRNTLVVRAGAEDTLVSFLHGDRLRHHESMRSLTAFDAPETICSRVMLLQDEYGIDEVHNVLLLSEEREEHLIDSFRAFFPEASVGSLRQHLPKGEGADRSSALHVPAVAAALRLFAEEPWGSAFEAVNLLPKRLLRRRIRLPFTWHTLAAAAVVVVTFLFFLGRFVSLQSDISDYKDQLRQYPPDLEMADARVLQGRIDSLQSVHEGYLRALGVLDTLLIGSDQWSRGMEHLAKSSAAVTGIWVDGWQPTGNALVQVTGNATSRDRIVDLAERTEGAIEMLNFSEIREWPVYSFRMQIPLKQELPEAARYLREQVEVPPLNSLAATAKPGAQPPPVAPAALRGNR